MGRSSADEGFAKDRLASDIDVITYDPKEGPACTVNDFRPDLVDGPDTAWNMSVVDVFVRYYASVDPDAEESTVRKLFRGHLKYLGTQYKISADGIQAMESRQRALQRADRQRAVSVVRLFQWSVPHAHYIASAMGSTPHRSCCRARAVGAHSDVAPTRSARDELRRV